MTWVVNLYLTLRLFLSGKTDLTSLTSYSNPAIYIESQSEGDHTTYTQLSQEILSNLLCESALCTIGVSAWGNDVRLTELGANSFDIVRLSTHFMKIIRSHAETEDMESVLVELLLTATLEQVATQLFNMLQEGTKRKRSISVNEVPTGRKYARLTHATQGQSTQQEMLCWRAGKMFKNGK